MKNGFLLAGCLVGFFAFAGGCTPGVAVESSSQNSTEAVGESVWVSRPDGGKQCDQDSAQSLEAGVKELESAGIRILEKRKKPDGKIRIQMCGAPTGNTNAYRIPKASLPQAEALGFKDLH